MHGTKSKVQISVGIGLALVLVWSQSLAQGETATRLSQSTEGPSSAQTHASVEALDLAPLNEMPPLVREGGRLAHAGRSPVAHPTGRSFSIADAWTVISRDDDDDGFYHHIRVSFDADVADGTAWVYARLYLSLEGGPWNHFFTTDVFSIEGDASGDDYEVVTRLLDGYPTGYYDVLIELYDADYDVWVVNYGPYEDRDLAVLPLEDRSRDIDYGYDGGGGGAMGVEIWLLVLLAMTIGFRSRPGCSGARHDR